MSVTAYVLIQTEVGRAEKVAKAARDITGVVNADNVVAVTLSEAYARIPVRGERQEVLDQMRQVAKNPAGFYAFPERFEDAPASGFRVHNRRDRWKPAVIKAALSAAERPEPAKSTVSAVSPEAR